ncbi:hypothetical protein JHE71_003961, partial [Salmonella enterica subsp. enterica serovar Anatum]|nr:hypothetical protein [Salmonella enterica subsp. enterica serovar Anatum]
MLTPVHSQFAQQAPSQKAGIMPFTTVFCIFINLGLGETAKQAAGAVQKTGDEMSGKLTLPQTSSFGVNTNNTLGGSSIAIGDNDTGFKQNGDGILDTFANSQHTVRVAPGEMMVLGAIRAGKEKK